jgi:hypothetical protein
VLVILISGKQGSGKSSLAQGLERHFEKQNQKCFMLKFATPLYQMHDRILDLLNAYEYPVEKGKIDGALLQLLGTEWGRAKDPDIWANIAVNRTRHTFELSKARVVIFDDCRFENEFTKLDANFERLFTIRLEADEYSRKLRAEKWRDKTEHPSETGLDEFANRKMFDLTLNTTNSTPADTLRRVIAHMGAMAVQP